MQPAITSGAIPHQWDLVGAVLVSRTIPGSIRDETWSDFLETLRSGRPEYCLMFCAGTIGVDAPQRRRWIQAAIYTEALTIVLSDDRRTRGLAMTVAWFGARLDAYSWCDASQALDRMRIDALARLRLHDHARDFHTRFRELDQSSAVG